MARLYTTPTQTKRIVLIATSVIFAASLVVFIVAYRSDDAAFFTNETKITGGDSGEWIKGGSLETVKKGERDEAQAGISAKKPRRKAIKYITRLKENRLEALKKGGGDEETEAAVANALNWLIRHQAKDGRWSASGFSQECDPNLGRCSGPGGAQYDTGITGLALLALLGAGNTDIYGEHQENVRRALRYLKSAQGDDGLFGGAVTGNYMYNHTIAAFAVCEILAFDEELMDANILTKKSRISVVEQREEAGLGKRDAEQQMEFVRDMARRAVYYLEEARNPNMAWRYRYRCGDNDTSVTGWAVLALSSARSAKIFVSEDAILGARRWFGRVTDSNTGITGYASRGRGSMAMIAAGIVCPLYLGASKDNLPYLDKSADRLMQCLPPTRNQWRVYYWYYGSLALFQVGGDRWKRWNAALKPYLLGEQHKDGCLSGSWDPMDGDGGAGGRVYSTAMSALCLEVYYRYPKGE